MSAIGITSFGSGARLPVLPVIGRPTPLPPGDLAPGDRPERPERPNRPDHPHRTDRPVRPERPERPERPVDVFHRGRSQLAHATRRFVHEAKTIIKDGGTMEDVEALSKNILEKIPALEKFPSFQKILERIAYNLNNGSTSIVLDPTIPDPILNVRPTPDPIRTIQPFPLPNFRGPIRILPFPPAPIVAVPHKHPVYANPEPTEAVASLTELGPDADGESENALPPTDVSIIV